jgi:hypothetical protein
MAATVVVVAAVARAAASARQILDHHTSEPPRHRADHSSAVPVAPMPRAEPPATTVPAPSSYHAFGPEPCVVPSRGAGARATSVTELEASGELDDDQMTATDRLLARRHAGDPVTTRPD